jgi:hypothetical protein
MSSLTDFTVQSNWVCVGLLFTRIWVFVCLQKFTKRELQITIKVLTLILTRDGIEVSISEFDEKKLLTFLSLSNHL